MNLKAYKAFTLMEMLISMVVISILMAVSVPMITQLSTLKAGIDKNTMKCITGNTSTGWYDTDGNGTTVLPASGTVCNGAVADTQYDRGKALNTALWYADASHGSTAQQAMAKKILKAACDLGGTRACDYFIDKCKKDGLAISPYCDVKNPDTSENYSDITYYLKLPSATYENSGATYILNQLESILPKMNTNLLNEVFSNCSADPTSIACVVAKPKIYIKACNNGNSAACEYAFNHDYNKSCSQVKTYWSDSPTGFYNLTYDDSGTIRTVSVDCNMSSLASASITGCNGATADLLTNSPDDDCSYAHNHGYNQSCSAITSNWSAAPSDTYNLTTNGAPPVALLSSTCTNNPPNHAACMASGIGTVCDDGTVYAGDVAGRHIFTTPTDEAGSYYWNNGAAGTLAGASNQSDGKPNYDILIALSNAESPYYAAQACKSRNNGPSNYGHADWYMPAINELGFLISNKTPLALAGGTYWASTEYDSDQARAKQLDGYEPNSAKDYAWAIRCVRYDAASNATCPTVGNVCADGTKYAGYYNSRYYFITPSDEVGTYTWGNGFIPGRVYHATIDANYGKNDTATLLAAVDSGSPYMAAQACGSTLNSAPLRNFGYTDWYLPADNEVHLLYTNQIAIGGFTLTKWYLSTTELSSSQVKSRRMSDGNSTSNKYALNAVRCVRSE